jgi:hypothetical protein
MTADNVTYLWIKRVVKETIFNRRPPPLHSSPWHLWFMPTELIYILILFTTADRFPRSPWKFRMQIRWHFSLSYSPISFFRCLFFLWACSKTTLTEEPDSIVYVGASPGCELLPSWAGSERLTHLTSEIVYWSEPGKVWLRQLSS